MSGSPVLQQVQGNLRKAFEGIFTDGTVATTDFLGGLPTNFGKSIIYQINSPSCGFIWNSISTIESCYFEIFPSPLVSMINDQISSCVKLHIPAIKLSLENLENEKVTDYSQQYIDYDILFTTPENLFR